MDARKDMDLAQTLTAETWRSLGDKARSRNAFTGYAQGNVAIKTGKT